MCLFCEIKEGKENKSTRVIECKNCNKIVKLPKEGLDKNVRKLIFRGCARLTRLDLNENNNDVEEIIVEDCKSFISVGGSSTLKKLKVVNCPLFDLMYGLKEVSLLNRGIGLGLKKVVVKQSGCEIIEMRKGIKRLNCSYNNALKLICESSSLVKLDCRGCINLKSLPFLPMLKELNCSESGIVSLENFPRLEVLNCSNCDDLKSIIYLPCLKEINFNGCGSLKKIDMVRNPERFDGNIPETMKVFSVEVFHSNSSERDFSNMENEKNEENEALDSHVICSYSEFSELLARDSFEWGTRITNLICVMYFLCLFYYFFYKRETDFNLRPHYHISL